MANESDPVRGVTLIKNLLIPMRDGIHLAADLYMPAGQGPFPVVLEYLPYRKDDVPPHVGYHPVFARHGYIGCRVDIRGTGASEGISTDEYVRTEQEDGYDVIEWLAAQAWCDGQVAMFGFSYGGFVCYQVATLQPPHLKAIVPCYATDDRYTDDCHYRGGLLCHYYDFAAYGAWMIAMNALPPYAEFSGTDWARIWEEHLEHNVPYMLTWIEQQVDGPYWRPGSLRGQYDRILCPTFIIGGWRDGYTNTGLRVYGELKDRVPARVLMGPWNHTPPDAAVPGPCIDYQHEVVRWLDHHLKGRETGVEDEAPVQVFMQRYDEPFADRTETSGEWRGEATWPCLAAADRVFALDGAGRLTEGAPGRGGFATEYDQYRYHPAVGLSGGLWSGGIAFGLPTDQRPDEVFALTYSSDVLSDEIAILGHARAILHVSSTAEIMAFVVSLCDVALDGASALVAKGILNATRRESFATPTPLVPGDIYPLEIEIDCTGWIFAPGHRIRLNVASADYPNLWPTPSAGTNRLYRGEAYPSRLILPVVPPVGSAPSPSFRASSASQRASIARVEVPQWRTFHDVLGQRVGLELQLSNHQSLGARLESENWSHTRSHVSLRDPADVAINSVHRLRRSMPDMTVEAQARMHMRGTVGGFHLTIDLEVTLDGMRHFNRRWVKDVPRLLL